MSLEGEALLIGSWKNVEELEESLTLEELELVVNSARKKESEREKRWMTFYAIFKGVDLNENYETSSRFDEIERRAQSRLTGQSIENIEWDELGIDFISE